MSIYQNITARLFCPLALAMFALSAPAAAHPTIDIAASNWHFTPSTITVEAGQTTTLRLTSTSGTHGIASDELGIAATTIAPGRFVEVSFTPRTGGTYLVHCSVYCGAGHADMVLTVIVTAAAQATTPPTAIPQPAARPSPITTTITKSSPTPKPMIDDRHYIIVVVYHDRLGLQMAQLAVKSSHHSEVRTWAKSLTARNAAAIAQLQQWYKAWYKASVPAMPTSMPTAMPRSMSPESLSTAPDLDRALLVAAMQEDSMGASMSLGAEQGLSHIELRRFARSAAATQVNDVQQLWTWFKQWYPVR